MERLQAAFHRGHGEMFKSTLGSAKTLFSTVKIISTVIPPPPPNKNKNKGKTEINV